LTQGIELFVDAQITLLGQIFLIDFPSSCGNHRGIFALEAKRAYDFIDLQDSKWNVKFNRPTPDRLVHLTFVVVHFSV
jgi:hypothetical protein